MDADSLSELTQFILAGIIIVGAGFLSTQPDGFSHTELIAIVGIVVGFYFGRVPAQKTLTDKIEQAQRQLTKASEDNHKHV
jgi:hypothetical protein